MKPEPFVQRKKSLTIKKKANPMQLFPEKDFALQLETAS